MIRNTLLALAAAATLAMTAQAASAGGYGYYGGYGYKSYHSYHGCKRIFVGYRTVWTYYGYVQKPIYKKVCGYGY
jgi:hypothetical protein